MKQDKVGHFTAGLMIGLVAWGLTGNLAVIVFSAAAAGMLKEWYDSRGHGHVDFWDFVATAMGGIVVACLYWVAVRALT